jgi:hypothetical protein
MRKPLLLLAAAAVMSAPADAVQKPLPVQAGLETQYKSYRMTGLIEAPFSWGSGVVAGHQRVVLSCAHVIYDNIFHRWTSGARWYRAYNGTGAPPVENAEVLNGYYYWKSYSSAVRATQRAGYRSFLRAMANEFNQDAIAYFSYADDLGDGEFAAVLTDGAARLRSGNAKWITGYPSGLYSENDPVQYRLHDTGDFGSPLWPEYNKFRNYLTAYYVAETGAGNSGGPVWMSDAGEPRVVGILVSGAEQQTEGDSFIGVHAVSPKSWDLIGKAINTVDRGNEVVTNSYPVSGQLEIPDAVARPRTGTYKPGEVKKSFRVSGMPKIINEVRIDLEISHRERRDLLVILETPNKKRLPLYDGDLDTNGQQVLFENEEAPLFYGLNPNGRWVLRVIDMLPGDTGQVISATLHISAR